MIEDPLLAELAALRAEVHGLRDKVASLELENTTLSDNQLIQLRLIHALKEKKPGKTELSRAEKIERYLAARPDHRAAFETLKGYLQLDNVRLNEAITTLMSTHPGRYSIQKATTGDKRKKILIMLPK